MKEDMRKAMATRLKEKNEKASSERNARADALIEKWDKRTDIGEGLSESAGKSQQSLIKARNTAIILENVEREMSKLTETQISTSFGAKTPENALKLVRLGYGAGIRGDVFSQIALETANDTIFYFYPVYAETKRDGTSGNVTYENSTKRFASEIEVEVPTQVPNGVITTFTGMTGGNLGNPPLRPYTVLIFVNGIPQAQDDGEGGIINLSGSTLITEASSSVVYSSGAISVVFAAAPATGTVIKFQYSYHSEYSAQYTDLGTVEMRLRAEQMRLYEYRLGMKWSKLSEILIGSTLSVEEEEALLRSGADELTKSLDFLALRMGYDWAGRNTSSIREFDASYFNAGADSLKAHVQGLKRVILDTGDDIYNELNRGAVSKIYASSSVVNLMSMIDGFIGVPGAMSGNGIGAYKFGDLDGIEIFKVPSGIVPQGEAVCVFRNPNEPNDMAIALGDYLPFYKSPKIEYLTGNSEQSVTRFGSDKVLQSKYLRKINIKNYDKY